MPEELDAVKTLKEKFYDPIREIVESEKKLNKKSVFVTFMYVATNELMRMLESVSVKCDAISQNHLSLLLEKNWIRGGNRIGEYIITAKGLWKIESDLGSIDIVKLVDIIDSKKYKMKIGRKLKDEDKVVTLTLIALRSYYEKVPINRDLANNDQLISALNDSVEILKKMGSISQSYVLSKPKAGEDAVTYVFRRTDPLPRDTRNIYKIGRRENYLSIYDPETDKISEYDLGYLLWKVFGGNLTREQEKEIVMFCDDLLIEYQNYIYTKDMRIHFVFSDIKHKQIIETALFNIPNHKKIWEQSDGK